MSKKPFVLAGLGIAGVATYVVATGFPRRVGLTASEAELSLPGDLVIPQPARVADRSRTVHSTPEALWPALLGLEAFYSSLWDRPLTLVTSEDQQFMVWQASGPGDWTATLSANIIPDVDGTAAVHVRERYAVASGGTRNLVVASAFATPVTLARLTRPKALSAA